MAEENHKTVTEVAAKSAPVIKQWVDWIPQDNKSQDEDDTKLTSLDVTESHWTTESVPDEDWNSVVQEDDDMMIVVPHAMLIENDPALQHELLLEDDQYQNDTSHSHNSTDGGGVVDVQAQQRLLYERMKASWQTRRMLRPHIQQRASLVSVLKSIEDSSVTLRRHVLAGASSSSATAAHNAKPEKMTSKDKKVSLHSSSSNKNDDNDDDMMICDDPNDQEMLVSALTQDYDEDEQADELEGLDDGVVDSHNCKKQSNSNEEDIMYTYVRNHHDHDDVMMMMIPEEDLPEPPELTPEDIDKVDFFWLVRTEQENSSHHQ
eukprot:scaffold8008_cov153-Amphora_coffeaeformis.AAC.3